jgi:hypothetical protein
VKLGQASDSTYASAGFVGVALRGTSGRLDDYSAGAVTLAGLPGAPTGLTAAWSGSSVHLSWSAPASDGGSAIVSYRIYRGTSSGSEQFVTGVGQVTAYDDPGLTNGSYFYKVSAVNGSGEGPQSAEASLAPGPSAVLDDFNRGDESPLSDAGRWSGGVGNGGEVGLAVSGQQVACSLSTTCSAWWNASQFGPDLEASVSIPVLPGVGNAVRVYARLQSPGSAAVDGYEVRFQQQSGTDQVFIDRIDNGAITSLASLSQEFVAGDRLKIRVVGSTIEAWRYSAGSWVKLGQASDSTYASAGFVGVALRGTSGRLDDYSAGAAGP